MDKGYETLRAVLDEALEQCASGKGKDRHANGRPFDRQPMAEVTRIVGPGFPTGQVMKKAGEAAGMLDRGDRDSACQELLGAIIYAAATILIVREESDG